MYVDIVISNAFNLNNFFFNIFLKRYDSNHYSIEMRNKHKIKH